MPKTRTKKNPEGKMLGPFTKTELKMLREAVNSFETVIEDDVNEYKTRSESALDTYDELKRKIG